MLQVLCALLYIIRCKNKKKAVGDRFRSVGRTGLEPVTIETQTTTSTMLKFSKLVFIFYLIFTLFCAVFAPIFIVMIIMYISVSQCFVFFFVLKLV